MENRASRGEVHGWWKILACHSENCRAFPPLLKEAELLKLWKFIKKASISRKLWFLNCQRWDWTSCVVSLNFTKFALKWRSLARLKIKVFVNSKAAKFTYMFILCLIPERLGGVRARVCVLMRSRVQLLVTPWTVAHNVPCPWNFPGKNTGVGCRLLL